MAASSAELVLLFDVDHTLIDGVALRARLDTALAAAAGPEGARRFWQTYEAVRGDLGYVDLPETIERFGREAALGERVAAAVWGLDYAGCLFPGAHAAVEHARGLGLPVIVSDGDERFQRHKIRESGLEAAFAGEVQICRQKEREIEAIRARWPADRYVLIDDKPGILAAVKSAFGELVTTVLVEQGPYALEAAGGAPPDVRLPSIAAFGELDAGALGAG